MKPAYPLALLLCAASLAAQAAPIYTLVDLGTLGGDQSIAYSLNDHGQVVGSSKRADGISVGFLYENGHMTGLGYFDKPASGADPYSKAASINNSGQIVGTSSAAYGVL
jgi:probable HAF family extracellular repeat protein